MTALVITAKAVSEASAYHQVVFGWPSASGDPQPGGWTLCADVDADYLTAWEARIAGYVEAAYGRSHPMTVSGFTLDWYARIAGTLGGACFRVARRVPRLDRRSVAFRCHPEEHYPDGLAMLDERFWCLPDDEAAGEPEATVVPDEAALAGVLRAEVRAHADDFLAGYVSGAKLPRRHRIGAFFDGLDTGVWFGGGHADRGRPRGAELRRVRCSPAGPRSSARPLRCTCSPIPGDASTSAAAGWAAATTTSRRRRRRLRHLPPGRRQTEPGATPSWTEGPWPVPGTPLILSKGLEEVGVLPR